MVKYACENRKLLTVVSETYRKTIRTEEETANLNYLRYAFYMETDWNFLGNESAVAVIHFCRNKDVVVMAEETTDLKNRKLLNILMAPAEPKAHFRLVSTRFLNDGCSAVIISNAVAKCLMKMQVEHTRVVGFTSDNAPYMISAGKTLKQLYPRFLRRFLNFKHAF